MPSTASDRSRTRASNFAARAGKYATGEAARAEQILAGAGFKTPASEAVLVRSRTLGASDPAFRAGVGAVMTTLRSMPQVTNLRTGAAGETSRDGHAQLIQFDMRGKTDTAYDRSSRCWTRSPDFGVPCSDLLTGGQNRAANLTVASACDQTWRPTISAAGGHERARRG